MTADEKCAAEVSEPPWLIHWHRCNRPAKGTRPMSSWKLTPGVRVDAPVCGIHLRLKYAPRLAEGEQG